MNNMNMAQMMPFLRLFSSLFTGNNFLGIPGYSIEPGKSFAHSAGAYARSREQSAFTSPQTSALYDQMATNIYKSSMRMIGYTDKEIDKFKNDGGPKFLQSLAAFGIEMNMSRDLSALSKAAWGRYRYNQLGENYNNYRASYQNVGESILSSIADGTLQGYSIQDAFKVAGQLTRSGRYDVIKEDENNKRRANAVVGDLKRYARGIGDLKDALQGSLEDVLTSFENLTGSSALSMDSTRFKQMSRSLYNSIVHGGVTPQLLQNAIATQTASLQGTGATRTQAASAGMFNATVLANGINVEGASLDSVNLALNQRTNANIMSGRQKDLTAAALYYLNSQGKEFNAANIREFVSTQLRGNTDNATRWLQDHNVSGEFINSSYVQRQAATPELTALMHENDLNAYARQIDGLVAEGAQWGFTKEQLMYSTQDELINSVDPTKRNSKELQAFLSNLESTQAIAFGTDSANALQIARNTRTALTQQRIAKVSDIVQAQIGDNISQDGLAGVFHKMLRTGEATTDDVTEYLRSFLGINLNANKDWVNTKDGKQAIANALSGAGANDEYLQRVTKATQGMSSTAVSALMDTTQDWMQNGARGKTRQGLLKQFIDAKSDPSKLKAFTDGLAKAKKDGIITEEQAFALDYEARNQVDFKTTPGAEDVIKVAWQAHKYATQQGLKGDQASEFAQQVGRLRAGVYKDGDEAAVKDVIRGSAELKNLRSRVADTTLTASDRKKAQSELDSAVEKQYNRLTQKYVDPSDFFTEVLSLLKELINKD